MADIKCNVWYTEKDSAGNARKVAEESIHLDLDLVGSTDGTCAAKEIYIGSDEMPDGCVLQIDPTGSATSLPEYVEELSDDLDESKLYVVPDGKVYKYLAPQIRTQNLDLYPEGESSPDWYFTGSTPFLMATIPVGDLDFKPTGEITITLNNVNFVNREVIQNSSKSIFAAGIQVKGTSGESLRSDSIKFTEDLTPLDSNDIDNIINAEKVENADGSKQYIITFRYTLPANSGLGGIDIESPVVDSIQVVVLNTEGFDSSATVQVERPSYWAAVANIFNNKQSFDLEWNLPKAVATTADFASTDNVYTLLSDGYTYKCTDVQDSNPSDYNCWHSTCCDCDSSDGLTNISNGLVKYVYGDGATSIASTLDQNLLPPEKALSTPFDLYIPKIFFEEYGLSRLSLLSYGAQNTIGKTLDITNLILVTADEMNAIVPPYWVLTHSVLDCYKFTIDELSDDYYGDNSGYHSKYSRGLIIQMQLDIEALYELTEYPANLLQELERSILIFPKEQHHWRKVSKHRFVPTGLDTRIDSIDSSIKGHLNSHDSGVFTPRMLSANCYFTTIVLISNVRINGSPIPYGWYNKLRGNLIHFLDDRIGLITGITFTSVDDVAKEAFTVQEYLTLNNYATNFRLLREVVIPDIDNLDTDLYTQAPTFGDDITTEGIVFTLEEQGKWYNYLTGLTNSGQTLPLLHHVAYLDASSDGVLSFCFNTDVTGMPFTCRELLIVSDASTNSDTADVGLSNTISRITYTTSDDFITYGEWLNPYCELCLPVGDLNSLDTIPGLCHITLLGGNIGYMSSSSNADNTLAISGDAAKLKRFTATASEGQSFDAFTAVNMFLVRTPDKNFKPGSKFRIYGR